MKIYNKQDVYESIKEGIGRDINGIVFGLPFIIGYFLYVIAMLVICILLIKRGGEFNIPLLGIILGFNYWIFSNTYRSNILGIILAIIIWIIILGFASTVVFLIFEQAISNIN